MLKEFSELDFDTEFENYTEYNWQTLSKKYKDMLLIYDEFERSISNNQIKVIDIEQEFKQLVNYKKAELQEKYKLILIALQKYKEYFETANIDISASSPKVSNRSKSSNKRENSQDKKIYLKPEQLKHIRDSLKRKNGIIEDLVQEVQNYKKQLEDLQTSSNDTIEKLQLRQENLLSLLEVKLNSNDQEVKSVDLDKIKEFEEIRAKNLELEEKNTSLIQENNNLNQTIKKSNIGEKLSSKENEEKLQILKELSKILKSSKFDEDLVKRLQKQIQLNKNLLKRVSEYEKLEKQVEHSSSDYKKDHISFLRQVLPNIELFRSALPKPEQELNQQAKIWVKGFEMVYRKLWDEINQTNIEVINPNIGDIFDSNFEEVIEQVEREGFSKDEIVSVESYGFKYDGILLLPAKVKIQK